ELAFHLAREMRAAGKTISFDPNLRPTLWPSAEAMARTLNELASHADWVLPGLAEGRQLTGLDTPAEIARFYLANGARAGVVIKLGEAGAYYLTVDGREGTVAGERVERVVDTVGAGDGFAVGVISGLLEGRTVAEAVARGNRIGALAIQVIGDSEGLPSREQLDRLEAAAARAAQAAPAAAAEALAR
ncbi:PfkB family carbohydrate kinase, partial [Burkholderia gladioli]|nr:PfkB family carbohydrate kinase [Burkholderia gladioli]